MALAVETGRSPLTWSAHSTGTQIDWEHNKETGRREETGQIIATVQIRVRVRAFELLDRLGALLAGHDSFSLHNVSWRVDDDNPGWPLVRAAAIRAAVRKARDYAAALGGSVLHVEHIADVGLLGDGDAGGFSSARRSPRVMSGGGDEPEAPSLDPVPREPRRRHRSSFHRLGRVLHRYLSLSLEAPGASSRGSPAVVLQARAAPRDRSRQRRARR